MAEGLLDRVARRGPLLLDAAMGTRLIARGLDLRTDDPCLWNLAHPDAVATIHRADAAAGADAISTNTFGANRVWLDRFGRAGSVAAINRRGVELARAAAGPDRFVVGSIGPTASGDPSALREQVDALLGAGVDALALETCRLDQALAMLRTRPANRRLDSATPVLVGLFDWPEPIVATAHRLIEAGATIVGVNCGSDLALIDRLVDAFDADGEIPFWLKPSSGWPATGAGSPADFARLAARSPRGLTMLGGCCGTTEAHLRAIRLAWDDDASRQHR